MVQTVCARCDRPAHTRGLCSTHYVSLRRHGVIDKISPRDRFWQNVDQSGGPDVCWPWKRQLSYNGYGRHLRSGLAHRFALADALGRPIGTGLEAAHSCGNRACCNPRHLREATHAENMAERWQTAA